MRTPPPLITAFFRAGFLSVPCISQKISQIHFSSKETYLGSTGLFEGVEVFQRTATVRTPRSVDISSADLSISKAERSKAPVSGRCLFFLFFFVFFLYGRRAPGFLSPRDARAPAVGELGVCYLRAGSLRAPREASVLVSSAPSDPGQKAPQISVPGVPRS